MCMGKDKIWKRGDLLVDDLNSFFIFDNYINDEEFKHNFEYNYMYGISTIPRTTKISNCSLAKKDDINLFRYYLQEYNLDWDPIGKELIVRSVEFPVIRIGIDWDILINDSDFKELQKLSQNQYKIKIGNHSFLCNYNDIIFKNEKNNWSIIKRNH